MIEGITQVLAEDQPFFTSGAAQVILYVLVCNTIVLFITAIICGYLWAKELGRPSDTVFGRKHRDEHMKELINSVLEKRERDRTPGV